tara:strand:+ start:6792 stop:7487 length:696 start_codon:yes stop_codon:yes gene_type:complete
MRIGFTIFVALLGLALGMLIASNYTDQEQTSVPQLSTQDQDSNTIIQDLRVENAELYKQLTQIELRVNKDSTDNQALSDSYQTKIDELQAELQLLKTQVTTNIVDDSAVSQFSDVATSLEQHRVMLVELRKSLPQTREGSAGYWYNMKNIATKADPSLSSSVDRVILKIDNYYDWNDNNPGNQSSAQDFLQWQSDYRSSGAIAYEEASVAFTKDALQSVITKLESVVLMYD